MKNFSYAKSLYPDRIFILSDQYGLLKSDDEIAPYDVTLNKNECCRKKAWAAAILVQLTEFADLQNDEFIFLAGENYRKYMVPEMNN